MEKLYVKLDSDGVCIMYSTRPEFKNIKGIIELVDYKNNFKSDPQRFTIIQEEVEIKKEDGEIIRNKGEVEKELETKLVTTFNERLKYEEFKTQMREIDYEKETKEEIQKRTDYKTWLIEKEKEDNIVKEIIKTRKR